eukprot:UC1_evm9s642
MRALPTGRGFETYFGYWSGAEDYYFHDTKGGYDFNDDYVDPTTRSIKLRVALEYNGTYSTPAFTARAVEIIKRFTPASPKPLFLYLAYQNVHWPLEAPQAYLDKFAHIPDKRRQAVAAMASIMDDGIGNVTEALKQQGIFDNTLIIFTSDNGGPTNGNEGTMSNNYPLRGGKNTIWEGGTRVSACVAGAGIENGGRVSYEKMHASDWLPTLVSMAAGEDWKKHIPADEPPYLLGDGVNNWDMLSKGAPSARDWLVHEAHREDAQQLVHGNAFTLGDWKIIKIALDPEQEQGWAPPPGQDPSKVKYMIKCDPPPSAPFDCSKDYCLFNVTSDPCEHHNIASAHPDVVARLKAELSKYQATAVPPVQPQGCKPVLNKQNAWQPCDAPSTNGFVHF